MARVLVIDDDPLVLDLWVDALLDAGHQVLSAAGGACGVRMAISESPDVVITDVLMPEKDGIETLREVKAANPGIRVLVVSGGGTSLRDGYLWAADRLGADATLPKPVDIDRLCATVDGLAALATAPRDTIPGSG